MVRLKYYLSIGLIMGGLISFQGCSALFPKPQGPAFTGVSKIERGKADIYIYRPDSFVGSAIIFDLYNNEERIGGLINGSFLYHSVTPGIYHIWAETETKSEVIIEAKAGYAYFIEGSVSMGILQGRPNLERVSWEEARDKLYEVKLSTQ